MNNVCNIPMYTSLLLCCLLLVVLVIKILDLTVSNGGLIFLFYSQTAVTPITLFFNLDLGIETCFYDGLTA